MKKLYGSNPRKKAKATKTRKAAKTETKKNPFNKLFTGDDALYPPDISKLPEFQTIFIVKGEKTTDLLNEVIQLTGKSSAVAVTLLIESLWEDFLRLHPNMVKKRIRILPDNDKLGNELAKMVATVIFDVNSMADVKIVELPDLPEGGNFMNWYADFKEKNKDIDDEELAILTMKEIVKYCKQARQLR